MNTKDFYHRLAASAQDFASGVQPVLENLLRITIHPIEDLKSASLIKRLDQRGIDAFYYDQQGDIRGLASRMNYSSFARSKPAFTFRYKIWDKHKKCWDDNREFARKLRAANSPDEFILFPNLHIESYSEAKGSGLIGWSFAAKTKDIVNFISGNLDNPDKVRVFTPTVGELRQVISVAVEVFARDYAVTEIMCLGESQGCLSRAV